MPLDRDEQLARIYGRGTVLRRSRSRRLLAAGAGAVAVLVLAGAVLAVDADRGDGTVVTADDSTEGTSPGPTTSSTAPPPTTDLLTTVPAEPAPVLVPPTVVPTTVPGSAEPADPPPPPTTAPPLVCRNSIDPACGPMYYDWPEPNRPVIVSITASPAMPRVGEMVTFTVTIDDPDGDPEHRCSSLSGLAFWTTGMGELPEESGGFGLCGGGSREGFGPWDPPPPWHAVETYQGYFGSAGDYPVTYTTEETGRCDGALDCLPGGSAEVVLTVLP